MKVLFIIVFVFCLLFSCDSPTDSKDYFPVRLTPDLSNEGAPKWNHDGSKIVYSSDKSGINSLYIMESDGTNSIQITDSSGSDLHAHWSLDGLKIVFQSNRSGNNDIWIMNSDGTNLLQLTTNESSDNTPDLNPDNSNFIFSTLGTIIFSSLKFSLKLYEKDFNFSNFPSFNSDNANASIVPFSSFFKNIENRYKQI